MTKNDMGAFPIDNSYTSEKGMTLRDYFAGQALASMLATPQKFTSETPEVAASWAYKFADAMMSER